MAFAQFDPNQPVQTSSAITALAHTALVRALRQNPAGGSMADNSPPAIDCGILAEQMVNDSLFLKELRFLVMLAFKQAPASWAEVNRALGAERMRNIVIACILLDRLAQRKDLQWCLHRALFLADVCWAVCRLRNVAETEQVYIVRLLQSLDYLPLGWHRQVRGGERLLCLMQAAELAVGDMPVADLARGPLGSMIASHEWLAAKNMDEFLDSLTIQ